MSARYRRFEILLPLQFNDGKPVPSDLIADTLIQLRNQFDAVSSENLTPAQRRELADGLAARLIAEMPEMLAAIDEADRSLAADGGVPVEDVRRNLRQWITS